MAWNWSEVLVLVSGTIVGNWLIFYVKPLENQNLCGLCRFTPFTAVHFLQKSTQNRRKNASSVHISSTNFPYQPGYGVIQTIVPSFQWPHDGKGNGQEVVLSSLYFCSVPIICMSGKWQCKQITKWYIHIIHSLLLFVAGWATQKFLSCVKLSRTTLVQWATRLVKRTK